MPGAAPAISRKGPTLLVGIIQVGVASLVATWIGWTPLAQVPLAVQAALAQAGFANVQYERCSNLEAGSAAMFVCSSGVAIAAIALGPLVVAVVLFLFRRQLTSLLKAGVSRLPVSLQHLGAPLIATPVFLVGWAGVHLKSSADVGFVAQSQFPAAIGLFTYLAARYTPALQRSLEPWLAARDRLPGKLRVAAAIGLPMIIGIAVTWAMADESGRINQQALTEQIVVVLSLVAGFVALLPRDEAGQRAQGPAFAGVRR
jgi:hypothetical protein